MLIFWFLIFPVSISTQRLFRDPVAYHNIANDKQPYSYLEEYLKVDIDHFSFGNSKKFPLRYFINLTYYQPGGPIFFYTGNEGRLEAFAQNTGFMWDNAAEFKAALVFAEHRYYGKSLPFGNKSYTSVQNLQYLSSEQALADFADVITYLKAKRIPKSQKAPVIIFGGSYGGMLGVWFRVKYPHLCDGVIAGSSPVFWFANTGVPPESFFNITARTFKAGGCDLNYIRSAFDAMKILAQTDDGRSYLNNIFRLDDKTKFRKPSNYNKFMIIFIKIMESAAVVDYPYPASFMADLPAYPVKKMCERFKGNIPKDLKEVVRPLYDLINVFYNTSGKVKLFCLVGKECNGDMIGARDGWNWQTCTEMIMPICSSGLPNDVFDNNCPFDLKQHQERCLKKYSDIGYTIDLYRPNWIIENYGNNFTTATNIVFSNGYLDPWSAGGWRLKPTKEGELVSLILYEGAHHYDLRGNHPNDTEEVKKVRNIEKEYIRKWIGANNKK